MFIVVQPKSWEDMRHLVSEMPNNWVFRGQSNEKWGLSSSLERELGLIIDGNRRKIVEYKEKSILVGFMRRAHHYIPSPPIKTESLEWLALIQHHGGATRLLDFSHSFYVAAFFSVENNMPESDAAIWSVNTTQLDKALLEKMDEENRQLVVSNSNIEHIELAKKLLSNGIERNLVFAVEPERMNERLAVQQGLFLFPCNAGVSFEQNLAGVFDRNADVFNNTPAFTYDREIHKTEVIKNLLDITTVLKIIVPRYMREEMLKDLWNMNVSSATLFPGIDGFTRSLNYYLI